MYPSEMGPNRSQVSEIAQYVQHANIGPLKTSNTVNPQLSKLRLSKLSIIKKFLPSPSYIVG